MRCCAVRSDESTHTHTNTYIILTLHMFNWTVNVRFHFHQIKQCLKSCRLILRSHLIFGYRKQYYNGNVSPYTKHPFQLTSQTKQVLNETFPILRNYGESFIRFPLEILLNLRCLLYWTTWPLVNFSFMFRLAP